MNYWIPSLEDYDLHLLETLKQIKVDLNGDGNLQPIHVTYFSPEPEGEEDKDFLRPAIVLFMYDEVHDITREHSIMSNVVADTPTDVTLKRVPTPTKFFYQMTILTDYQQHMNEIIRQLNLLFPKRGYITLKAPNGGESSYDFFQRGVSDGYSAQYIEFGANEQRRIFRKIYKYVLHTEIDEYQSRTYKKVQSRNTRVNNTNL